MHGLAARQVRPRPMGRSAVLLPRAPRAEPGTSVLGEADRDLFRCRLSHEHRVARMFSGGASFLCLFWSCGRPVLSKSGFIVGRRRHRRHTARSSRVLSTLGRGERFDTRPRRLDSPAPGRNRQFAARGARRPLESASPARRIDPAALGDGGLSDPPSPTRRIDPAPLGTGTSAARIRHARETHRPGDSLNVGPSNLPRPRHIDPATRGAAASGPRGNAFSRDCAGDERGYDFADDEGPGEPAHSRARRPAR